MKFLFTVILCLTISISSSAQFWKTYPYTPAGESQVSFPDDEGRHVGEPTEWWYTTGHIVGETTGKNYSYMLSYFYYPVGPADGFRILNISDDDNLIFHTDMRFVNYTNLPTDKLDIQASIILGGTESWKNKYSGDIMLPFQYEIYASSSDVTLSLDYNTTKHPLILGDDGYLLQGEDEYTYYYSITGITTTGTITYDGVTENITGNSWIDRQYGTISPQDGAKYEWFSIQLSNNMDINLWNIFTDTNQIPDDEKFRILAAYVGETTDVTTQYTNGDFELERLEFAYTTDGERCYAQKWRLTSPVNDVDLIITTLNSDSEVPVPFKFYEGATEIEGTVNGIAVTGFGFTELLHTYEVPQLTIDTDIWNENVPLNWEVTNPDDGNVLHYNLEYSTDNQVSFNTIDDNLADTSYDWSTTVFSEGDVFWFKVVASSVDGTLVSETVKEITYSSTANVKEDKMLEVMIYPNPTSQSIKVVAENIQKMLIYNVNGQLIDSIAKEQIGDSIIIKDYGKGVYSIKIQTNKSVVVKKIIVK